MARFKRLALAIGLPTLAVAGAAAWAGASLIAPGTTVAGVEVGFMLPSAAAERVEEHVTSSNVEVAVDGITSSFSGADLGAEIDASAVIEQAHGDRPLWAIGQWGGSDIQPQISFDSHETHAALGAAFPELWTSPVDATVEFSGNEFTAVPATNGQGVNPVPVQDAFVDAVLGNDAPTSTDLSTIAPSINTAAATSAAEQLNQLATEAGFYADGELVLGIEPEEFGQWVQIDPRPEDGVIDFTVTADAETVAGLVEQLPDATHRDPVDGSAITNAAGNVLEELTPTVDGQELTSTAGISDAFAAQLAEHDSTFDLEVTAVPAATETFERTLEVDLSEQRLYLKENGEVVDTWLVSTGTDKTPTTKGNYSLGWRTPIQTMYGDDYVQPDVKWPMYFNGDEAFHGVYWHDNWGQPMSHGCVGMPDDRAKQIWDWAPEGTDVVIHD